MHHLTKDRGRGGGEGRSFGNLPNRHLDLFSFRECAEAAQHTCAEVFQWSWSLNFLVGTPQPHKLSEMIVREGTTSSPTWHAENCSFCMWGTLQTDREGGWLAVGRKTFRRTEHRGGGWGATSPEATALRLKASHSALPPFLPPSVPWKNSEGGSLGVAHVAVRPT